MARCGDGVRAATEMCEANDLNGATCNSLGYTGGGKLECNKTTCAYDVLMCRMGGSTGSAGTTGGAGTSGGSAGTKG